MFWRRRRGTAPEVPASLHSAIVKPHKGELLDAAVDDAERYRMCIGWAEAARNAYYEGRRNSILAIMYSTERRYRDYSAKVRVSIGERIWTQSPRAKDLAGLEQMYSRWAGQYAPGIESRG